MQAPEMCWRRNLPGKRSGSAGGGWIAGLAHWLGNACAMACVVWGGGAGVAEEAAVPAGPFAAGAKFPGPTETGFLLPNGWHLTPAASLRRQMQRTCTIEQRAQCRPSC